MKNTKRHIELQTLSKEELIEIILDLEGHPNRKFTFEEYDARRSGPQTKALNNYLEYNSKIEDVFYGYLSTHKKIPSCDFVLEELKRLYPEYNWINDSWANPEKNNIRIYKTWLSYSNSSKARGFK